MGKAGIITVRMLRQYENFAPKRLYTISRELAEELCQQGYAIQTQQQLPPEIR